MLRESVSFKKSDEEAVLKGEFELYEDHVVLNISHRFALSELVRPLPPTFPYAQMRESIPFSRVTAISGVTKKGSLARSTKIEIQTDEGVTWDIKGPVRILDLLRNAYQAWKQSGSPID